MAAEGEVSTRVARDVGLVAIAMPVGTSAVERLIIVVAEDDRAFPAPV
jgi:hypothetical protein